MALARSISLCMIVKDEAAHLRDCLASVADLVDEVIVVDTGSSDETPNIARRFAAQVVDFPWTDNFSAARNHALSQARGDWIFWMDADERLDLPDRQRFQQLKGRLPEANHVYLLPQRSSAPGMHGAAQMVYQARLFRRLPEVAWRYRVHEQVLPSLEKAGAKLVASDVVIQHLGYADNARRLDKVRRNLRLLLEDHAESPDDAFILFNLAHARLDLGEADEALRLFECCIRSASSSMSFLPKAYLILSRTSRTRNQPEEALRHCLEGRDLFPDDPELGLEEGLIHQSRDDFARAQRCFEQVLALPRYPSLAGVRESLDAQVRHRLASVLLAQRQYDAAAGQWRRVIADAPQLEPAWLSLAELLLRANQVEEAEALAAAAAANAPQPYLAATINALLELKRRNVDAAASVLEYAIYAHPDVKMLRLFLSDVLIKNGRDLGRAKHHLAAVLELDPQDQNAQSLLNQVKQRQFTCR